jgi:hypothetical protein
MFPDFISEMRKRSTVFTDGDVEFVIENMFFLGIKSKCERERLFEDLRADFDRWGNENLIAVTDTSKGEFSRPEIFELLDWIYKNNSAEIRVYRKSRMADQNDWITRIPEGAYK